MRSKAMLYLGSVLITLCFCLPTTLATHPAPTFHATATDPTTITVHIYSIRSLDIILKKPSFQVDVIIDGVDHQSPIWKNTPYVYDINWTATQQLNGTSPWSNITIKLTDTNTGKLCDLSPCHEATDTYNDTVANLEYNTNVGHWVGDDYAFWWDEGQSGQQYDIYPDSDPSGYGHLNGCDDGSINQLDRDCELTFDITQTTPTPDGLPLWVKTAIYHLNATTDYTGYDPNHDGIPLTWDWKWGYDPFANDSHAAADPDNDGLNNTKELLVSQYGSDPYHRDLYIEMDRMADSPKGVKSNLTVGAKELLRTTFAQHNIAFHLDDGCMGGGEVIPFNDNLSRDDLSSIYLNYFLHGNLSNWRRGIFHYGIVVYNAGYAGYNFFNGYLPYMDTFQISSMDVNKHIFPKTQARIDLGYASVYMHETGHNIGLNDFAGIDNFQDAYPWQKDWLKFLPYHSVMNYAYMYNMIGYSDGRNGKNDHNDWGNLDLARFQIPFEWHHHP